MFRVALISRWHPHSQKPDERYVKKLLSFPECSVRCVWDRDAKTAAAWAKEYNADFSTDLRQVVAREDVDGLIVTSNPSDHMEIYALAAEYGKHVFTEKVLSFHADEAKEIRRLVHESGIRFAIAFTRIGIPQLAYARRLLADGVLGTPVMFRCLCGHAGGVQDKLPDYWYDPQLTGGGAMIDLGFNSAYLARYIMGDVVSVSASFGYDILHKPVEDCASCNVRFQNGAMGLLDATFDSACLSVFELALYGTKGSYYARFGGGDMAELSIDGEGRKQLDIAHLPSPVPDPVSVWYKACTEGGSVAPYDVDAAAQMVYFMNAAYESAARNGQRVAVRGNE